MSTLNSANKEKNNKYTCINKSLCRKHLVNEKKILEGIEVERILQQVDIQVFEDLILEIYIPPTPVCSLTNYVWLSCSTLKMIFKKLYDDSPFNKLETFDGRVLNMIFSFLIPSDIEKLGDDSMFSKTELFYNRWSFAKQQN